MFTKQFTFGNGGTFSSGDNNLPVGVATIGAVAPSLSYQADEAWAPDRHWDQYWNIIPSGTTQSATKFVLNRTVATGNAGASVITITLTTR